MQLLTDEEQLALNTARQILRGYEVVHKFTKEILEQNDKLALCYKYMWDHSELENILAGNGDFIVQDKPGWSCGVMKNDKASKAAYEEYLHRIPKRISHAPAKKFYE